MNINIKFTTLKLSSLIITLLSGLFSSSLAYAVVFADATDASSYTSIPATILASDARPIVMLTMTNDHQLFYKAYTDFDDIIKADGSIGSDGTIETTYTNNFDYYGYFDSQKCYTYSVLSTRFNPVANAAGTNKHDCSGVALGRWSGNFLNWLTMSRMDVVRKVLYGGKRVTPESATETILERAYIPNDNHAWGKFYPAADINKFTPYSSADDATGLTFCNVSAYTGTEYSEDTVNSPRLRIAKGKWDLWAAQERLQCFWDGEAPRNQTSAESPNAGTEGLAELVVRVKVCDSTLLGTETCRKYGTNYKPTGLLQKYGEIEAIDFGLLTGSYQKGKSGGVLRKNISPIVNLATPNNSIDEINQATGQFNTSVVGIINTINKLRISRYSYNDNGYGAGGGTTANGTNLAGPNDRCPFGQNSWGNSTCANWGNPMGEIYLEALRYLSGAAGAHADFDAPNDSNWIAGLPSNVTWRDPYGAAQTSPVGGGYPSCAKPNIINISTGVLGFDHDEYSGASDVGGSLNVTSVTNDIGDKELSATNTYYVGDATTGGSAGDTCSATAIPSKNLGGVTGLCPEAAGLEGSFKIAGLSYYAHETDLRTAASSNDVDGVQTVDTYSIALAPPIPDIKVNVGGNAVRIIPVGYNYRNNNAMVLVNFQVISQTATSGEFFMNYENAPAGADHDSDFKGYLSYVVSGNEISITGHNTGSSAGSTMHMGYIIDGVIDAGKHYVATNRTITLLDNSLGGGTYSTTKALVDTACGALTLPASGGVDVCTTGGRDLRVARTHTAGPSTAKMLKSPLWYAAKWGNFEDIDGNNYPSTSEEWDTKNNVTGAFTPDGEPDNYFLVTNPALLERQLESALNQILQRISSGSAAAVIADEETTFGSVYQALYQPSLINDGKKITWIGLVHAILLDDNSNLREDTNGNKKLDSTDKYIKVKYSTDLKRTQIWYCTPGGSPLGKTVTCPGGADRKEISEFTPLWNTRDELATFSAKDPRLLNQRNYSSAFSNSTDGGRHITTWKDANYNDQIDAGEIIPFTQDSFNSLARIKHLGIPDSGNGAADIATGQSIVNFIRGYEDPATTGFRSRTIDYDNDGTDDVWRLGDIIHSSPITVGPPNGVDYTGEKINWTDYGDPTYDNYIFEHKDRRNVLYVGANDGMIHAFNAGFYDSAGKEYCLDPSCVNDESASHRLGAELWAYTPKNLLPQLKFLTQPDYPHVYYMDGPPRAFDVNIFPNDTKHPNGWGTILVVGMRLGGGANDPITIDSGGGLTTETGSAYVILDITDPENPPVVLGEYKNSALGFTTSVPTLTVKRKPSLSGNWATGVNEWGLVFGSGPNQLDTGLSTQPARLFYVKLELQNGVLDFSGNVRSFNTGIANSFIGSPTAKNWGDVGTDDFRFDAVYFGVAGGTELIPNGRLMRLTLDGDDAASWSLDTMLDSQQPFLNPPLAKEDADGMWWVFAGSGRLFTINDALSTAQQTFYGLRETPDISDLTQTLPLENEFSKILGATNQIQNSSDVFVNADESLVIPGALSAEYTGVTNFTELKAHMALKAGWYRNLEIPLYAERNLARATYYKGLAIFPAYTPNVDTCTSEGNSQFYYLYEKTGTNWVGLDLTQGPFFGIASELSIITDADGNAHLLGTTSTGEIVTPEDPDCPPGEPCGGPTPPLPLNGTGRQSWREIKLY